MKQQYNQFYDYEIDYEEKPKVRKMKPWDNKEDRTDNKKKKNKRLNNKREWN